MSPEKFSFLEDILFRNGARDIFKTPIVMKKGRLATKFSVLSDEEHKEHLLKLLFIHSTTIGVRIMPVQKLALDRRFVNASTEYGDVRFKSSYYGKKCTALKPEYDDIAAIAKSANITLTDAENLALNVYKNASKG